MGKQHTTKKERDYVQNKKFAKLLIGVEKGFFGRFKSNEGLFTEQEIIDAIVKCHSGKITEEDARANISEYVGDERYGTRHTLRDLAFLRNDTLGVNHVRTKQGKTSYRIYYYSRDVGF